MSAQSGALQPHRHNPAPVGSNLNWLIRSSRPHLESHLFTSKGEFRTLELGEALYLLLIKPLGDQAPSLPWLFPGWSSQI